MSYFYIKEITARGAGKTDSSISFSPKLNIIQGPCNSGKSCVLRCIDFVLGSNRLPFDESLGYTSVEMVLQTQKGEISITRYFHQNQVEITTNIENWEDGIYALKPNSKKKNPLPLLNDLLLYSIGITEPVEIIKNIRYERNRLTLRTFIHMLILDVNAIGRAESVIEPFDRNEKTPFLSALLYLIKGEALSQEEIVVEKKIQNAKRSAIEEYVKMNINRAIKRNNELEQELSSLENANINEEVQRIIDDLNKTDNDITEAVNQSKKILGETVLIQEKISECNLLLSRYDSLKTQYIADIKRLSFIVDGEIKHRSLPVNTTCPYCDGKIPVKNNKSYIDSARAELSRIVIQLNGLEDTIRQVVIERADLNKQLETLKGERQSIDLLVENKLQPKVKQLEDMLVHYNTYLRMQNEIQVITQFTSSWKEDLQNLPKEEKKNEYHPKDLFDISFVNQIEEYYKQILLECNYEPKPSLIYFNLQNFDVEIDNHKKITYQGQGYTSFINTVTALVFRKYLYNHAQYYPNFLVLDTPLLGFDQGVDDAAPESMRTALFRYFLNHQEEGQIIVIENMLHMPSLEYEKFGANVITFTKDTANGRYGFLLDVK